MNFAPPRKRGGWSIRTLTISSLFAAALAKIPWKPARSFLSL
jgi:hypothetical protein